MALTNETKKAMKAVNNKLFELSRQYHQSIPLDHICESLESNGFDTEQVNGLYCGSEGRANDHVGNDVYLTLSWYRMGSGRYEITAYLSR